jgi:hypothetical protein
MLNISESKMEDRVEDLSTARKRHLDTLKERLARIEKGEVLGNDHPGPYTPDEKAKEIAWIKDEITRIAAEETLQSNCARRS